MEWKSAVRRDNGDVKIPGRWLFLHYYEALNILFRMENSLRVFVYVVLKSKYNEDWSSQNLTLAEDENSTIASIATKRMNQAGGFGYLGYPVTSPLMFLNSGELIRLMTYDNNWPLFKKYFRGGKEVIKTKFEEIGTVRNSLAHYRPISSDDVSLIKQNVRHTFVGIEECLLNLLQTSTVTPSNTERDWFKHLYRKSSSFANLNLF